MNESIYSVSWSINARTLAVSSGANTVFFNKKYFDIFRLLFGNKRWICLGYV